jgi:hypothetical protein
MLIPRERTGICLRQQSSQEVFTFISFHKNGNSQWFLTFVGRNPSQMIGAPVLQNEDVVTDQNSTLRFRIPTI